MITMSGNWAQNITAPARYVYGKVEDLNTSLSYTPTDKLVSIRIEKTPAKGKFFGFAISQKATITLLDLDNMFMQGLPSNVKAYLGTPTEQAAFPNFYMDEFSRDEIKKTVTVTYYDAVNDLSKYTLKDVEWTNSTSLKDYAQVLANKLGVTLEWQPEEVMFLPVPPNFDGDENLRDVLTYVTEASGTIAFMDYRNHLIFKYLGNTPIYTIDKSQYFEFTLGEYTELNTVSHATELGENYSSGDNVPYNQIIRNNPFIENRADIQEMVDSIYAANALHSTYNYSLKWRGNPALEIGDYVTINDVDVYYMGETLEYKGGLVVTSEWAPLEHEPVDSTPRTLGEAVRQTYARVDKVNTRIDLVASDVADNEYAISLLQLTADGITASVEQMETLIEANNSKIDEEIAEMNKKVEATISAEDVKLEISTALNNGVNKVTTATGFTFNQDGLTVSKSGSEMTTQITEDGMTVYRDNMEVLVADNVGVTATNLHARTYLIIGNNSRLEDYIDANYEPRTGCFWIGG